MFWDFCNLTKFFFTTSEKEHAAWLLGIKMVYTNKKSFNEKMSPT